MKRISARQVQSSERFYRIPKIFVESPLYKPMSTDAKFTYAILKDRFELSLRNNWIDKNGDVYLIYTVTELQKILGYGNKKVIKLKKELQEYGLLEEVRQGLNKPNLLYLGNVDYQDVSTEEIHSKPSTAAEVSKRHFQKNQGNVKMTRQKMSKRHANDTENSETELSNDTNRYQDEIPLSTLSDSEAFQMGQHGFLSAQTIQRLSLFGKEAKLLENKIYQAKRQVEKDYSHLLQNQEMIYGEVWSQELEREVDKLIFKIKTGEHEGKPIKNIPGYFYKMMIRFWKMALLIEKEQGFIALSNQSNYAKQFPEECPSLISYYYPDKLSESKLEQYLLELSERIEIC
ncbi:replication initiator protein A [Streptococcus dysgalactiae]|uniref:Replication initiator protein A n=1 Tax=Streptococcus iniae TaxID=1346 RepID=A0A3L8GN97_STRIN|nr:MULTISPECIES: replication initiator protein A [Streptococcus]RLU58481.1 replication initiator protein A [Streptococcus iniae]WCE87025.1 replication initiator protein A [Streptococcus dysgalactiae]WCN27021.1 replication initiator protein A [Streptococcus dysgalactiae]